nr:GNAT family N-acetyltransferase [Glycomyces amatae]
MRIVRIESPGAGLDEVYRDLLAPFFPPHELDSREDIAAGVTAGTTEVLVAEDERGRRLGAAVGDWDEDVRVQLLSYLAVDPAHRSGGVGGRLLAAVVERWAEQYRPCAIVAEIEHPAEAAANPEWGDPKRRFDFYGRRGARVLDLPYFQPALRDGAERVWGMLLISLHLDPQLTAGPDRAAAEPIRGFLEGYFRLTEGGLPEDAAGKALLAAAADPEGVRLLPATTPIERLPRSAPGVG